MQDCRYLRLTVQIQALYCDTEGMVHTYLPKV